MAAPARHERASLARRGSGMFAEALGLQSSPEQPTAPGNMAAPPVAEQPVLQRSASVRKRDALRRWGAIEAAVRHDNVGNHTFPAGLKKVPSFATVVNTAVAAHLQKVRDQHVRRAPIQRSRSRSTEMNTFELQLAALRAEAAEEDYGSSSSPDDDEPLSGTARKLDGARSNHKVWPPLELGSLGGVRAPVKLGSLDRGDTEATTAPSARSPARDGSGMGADTGHLSLAQVMSNPVAYHFLRIFAEAEFAQESLLFLQSSDEVRSIPAAHAKQARDAAGARRRAPDHEHAAGHVEGQDYLEHRVKQVFRKFVAEGARLQVNLSDGVRARIAARVATLGEKKDTQQQQQQQQHAPEEDGGGRGRILGDGPGHSGGCLSRVFDEARHEVFELVETDAFARFCASPLHAQMLDALRAAAKRRGVEHKERRKRLHHQSMRERVLGSFGGSMKLLGGHHHQPEKKNNAEVCSGASMRVSSAPRMRGRHSTAPGFLSGVMRSMSEIATPFRHKRDLPLPPASATASAASVTSAASATNIAAATVRAHGDDNNLRRGSYDKFKSLLHQRSHKPKDPTLERLKSMKLAI